MEEGKKGDKSNSAPKLLVIGDAGAGKSSLIDRFVENAFQEQPRPDGNLEREINKEIGGSQFTIIDANPQARFQYAGNDYYRRANGIVIVFDVTDETSFSNVKQWLQEVDHHALNDVPKVIIGTKTDLVSARKVDPHTAKEFADQLGIPYVEVSSKNGTNVDEVFTTLSRGVIHKLFPAPAVNLNARVEIKPIPPSATSQSEPLDGPSVIDASTEKKFRDEVSKKVAEIKTKSKSYADKLLELKVFASGFIGGKKAEEQQAARACFDEVMMQKFFEGETLGFTEDTAVARKLLQGYASIFDASSKLTNIHKEIFEQKKREVIEKAPAEVKQKIQEAVAQDISPKDKLGKLQSIYFGYAGFYDVPQEAAPQIRELLKVILSELPEDNIARYRIVVGMGQAVGYKQDFAWIGPDLVKELIEPKEEEIKQALRDELAAAIKQQAGKSDSVLERLTAIRKIIERYYEVPFLRDESLKDTVNTLLAEIEGDKTEGTLERLAVMRELVFICNALDEIDEKKQVSIIKLENPSADVDLDEIRNNKRLVAADKRKVLANASDAIESQFDNTEKVLAAIDAIYASDKNPVDKLDLLNLLLGVSLKKGVEFTGEQQSDIRAKLHSASQAVAREYILAARNALKDIDLQAFAKNPESFNENIIKMQDTIERMILKNTDTTSSVLSLKQWLFIAAQCLKEGDYHTAHVIVDALSRQPVQNLLRNPAAKKEKAEYEQLRNFYRPPDYKLAVMAMEEAKQDAIIVPSLYAAVQLVGKAQANKGDTTNIIDPLKEYQNRIKAQALDSFIPPLEVKGKNETKVDGVAAYNLLDSEEDNAFKQYVEKMAVLEIVSRKDKKKALDALKPVTATGSELISKLSPKGAAKIERKMEEVKELLKDATKENVPEDLRKKLPELIADLEGKLQRRIEKIGKEENKEKVDQLNEDIKTLSDDISYLRAFAEYLKIKVADVAAAREEIGEAKAQQPTGPFANVRRRIAESGGVLGFVRSVFRGGTETTSETTPEVAKAEAPKTTVDARTEKEVEMDDFSSVTTVAAEPVAEVSAPAVVREPERKLEILPGVLWNVYWVAFGNAERVDANPAVKGKEDVSIVELHQKACAQVGIAINEEDLERIATYDQSKFEDNVNELVEQGKVKGPTTTETERRQAEAAREQAEAVHVEEAPAVVEPPTVIFDDLSREEKGQNVYPGSDITWGKYWETCDRLFKEIGEREHPPGYTASQQSYDAHLETCRELGIVIEGLENVDFAAVDKTTADNKKNEFHIAVYKRNFKAYAANKISKAEKIEAVEAEVAIAEEPAAPAASSTPAVPSEPASAPDLTRSITKPLPATPTRDHPLATSAPLPSMRAADENVLQSDARSVSAPLPQPISGLGQKNLRELADQPVLIEKMLLQKGAMGDAQRKEIKESRILENVSNDHLWQSYLKILLEPGKTSQFIFDNKTKFNEDAKVKGRVLNLINTDDPQILLGIRIQLVDENEDKAAKVIVKNLLQEKIENSVTAILKAKDPAAALAEQMKNSAFLEDMRWHPFQIARLLGIDNINDSDRALLEKLKSTSTSVAYAPQKIFWERQDFETAFREIINDDLRSLLRNNLDLTFERNAEKTPEQEVALKALITEINETTEKFGGAMPAYTIYKQLLAEFAQSHPEASFVVQRLHADEGNYKFTSSEMSGEWRKEDFVYTLNNVVFKNKTLHQFLLQKIEELEKENKLPKITTDEQANALQHFIENHLAKFSGEASFGNYDAMVQNARGVKTIAEALFKLTKDEFYPAVGKEAPPEIATETERKRKLTGLSLQHDDVLKEIERVQSPEFKALLFMGANNALPRLGEKLSADEMAELKAVIVNLNKKFNLFLPLYSEYQEFLKDQGANSKRWGALLNIDETLYEMYADLGRRERSTSTLAPVENQQTQQDAMVPVEEKDVAAPSRRENILSNLTGKIAGRFKEQRDARAARKALFGMDLLLVDLEKLVEGKDALSSRDLGKVNKLLDLMREEVNDERVARKDPLYYPAEAMMQIVTVLAKHYQTPGLKIESIQGMFPTVDEVNKYLKQEEAKLDAMVDALDPEDFIDPNHPENPAGVFAPYFHPDDEEKYGKFYRGRGVDSESYKQQVMAYTFKEIIKKAYAIGIESREGHTGITREKMACDAAEAFLRQSEGSTDENIILIRELLNVRSDLSLIGMFVQGPAAVSQSRIKAMVEMGSLDNTYAGIRNPESRVAIYLSDVEKLMSARTTYLAQEGIQNDALDIALAKVISEKYFGEDVTDTDELSDRFIAQANLLINKDAKMPDAFLENCMKFVEVIEGKWVGDKKIEGEIVNRMAQLEARKALIIAVVKGDIKYELNSKEFGAIDVNLMNAKRYQAELANAIKVVQRKFAGSAGIEIEALEKEKEKVDKHVEKLSGQLNEVQKGRKQSYEAEAELQRKDAEAEASMPRTLEEFESTVEDESTVDEAPRTWTPAKLHTKSAEKQDASSNEELLKGINNEILRNAMLFQLERIGVNLAENVEPSVLNAAIDRINGVIPPDKNVMPDQFLERYARFLEAASGIPGISDLRAEFILAVITQNKSPIEIQEFQSKIEEAGDDYDALNRLFYDVDKALGKASDYMQYVVVAHESLAEHFAKVENAGEREILGKLMTVLDTELERLSEISLVYLGQLKDLTIKLEQMKFDVKLAAANDSESLVQVSEEIKEEIEAARLGLANVESKLKALAADSSVDAENKKDRLMIEQGKGHALLNVYQQVEKDVNKKMPKGEKVLAYHASKEVIEVVSLKITMTREEVTVSRMPPAEKEKLEKVLVYRPDEVEKFEEISRNQRNMQKAIDSDNHVIVVRNDGVSYTQPKDGDALSKPQMKELVQKMVEEAFKQFKPTNYDEIKYEGSKELKEMAQKMMKAEIVKHAPVVKATAVDEGPAKAKKPGSPEPKSPRSPDPGRHK